MKKYIEILEKSSLFYGIDSADIQVMLGCLGASTKSYKKGEYILKSGENTSNITLLLSGKLHIQKDDYWGNRSIISVVQPGDMFGEAYIASNSGALMNDVVAIEASTVMFLDIHKILTLCSSACKFHALTVQNLFFTIAEKNRTLVTKLGILSKRTTREKLISYLSEQAKLSNNSTFKIPFNRQQLADFLSVDRSAMSNELCKMRDAGMLEFNKSKFTLK